MVDWLIPAKNMGRRGGIIQEKWSNGVQKPILCQYDLNDLDDYPYFTLNLDATYSNGVWIINPPRWKQDIF